MSVISEASPAPEANVSNNNNSKDRFKPQFDSEIYKAALAQVTKDPAGKSLDVNKDFPALQSAIEQSKQAVSGLSDPHCIKIGESINGLWIWIQERTAGAGDLFKMNAPKSFKVDPWGPSTSSSSTTEAHHDSKNSHKWRKAPKHEGAAPAVKDAASKAGAPKSAPAAGHSASGAEGSRSLGKEKTKPNKKVEDLQKQLADSQKESKANADAKTATELELKTTQEAVEKAKEEAVKTAEKTEKIKGLVEKSAKEGPELVFHGKYEEAADLYGKAADLGDRDSAKKAAELFFKSATEISIDNYWKGGDKVVLNKLQKAQKMAEISGDTSLISKIKPHLTEATTKVTEQDNKAKEQGEREKANKNDVTKTASDLGLESEKISKTKNGTYKYELKTALSNCEFKKEGDTWSIVHQGKLLDPANVLAGKNAPKATNPEQIAFLKNLAAANTKAAESK